MDGIATMGVDAGRVLDLILNDKNVTEEKRAELTSTLMMCAGSQNPENHTLMLSQIASRIRRPDQKGKEYRTQPIMRPGKDGGPIPVHYALGSTDREGWQLESLQSYLEHDDSVRNEWQEATRLRTTILEIRQGSRGPVFNLYSAPPQVMQQRIMDRAGSIHTMEDTAQALKAEADWRRDANAFEHVTAGEFAWSHDPKNRKEDPSLFLSYLMLPDQPGMKQAALDALRDADVPAAALQRGKSLMVMYPSFVAEKAQQALLDSPTAGPYARDADIFTCDDSETKDMRDDFPDAFVSFDQVLDQIERPPSFALDGIAVGTKDIKWLPPDVREELKAGAWVAVDDSGLPFAHPAPAREPEKAPPLVAETHAPAMEIHAPEAGEAAPEAHGQPEQPAAEIPPWEQAPEAAEDFTFDEADTQAPDMDMDFEFTDADAEVLPPDSPGQEQIPEPEQVEPDAHEAEPPLQADEKAPEQPPAHAEQAEQTQGSEPAADKAEPQPQPAEQKAAPASKAQTEQAQPEKPAGRKIGSAAQFVAAMKAHQEKQKKPAEPARETGRGQHEFSNSGRNGKPRYVQGGGKDSKDGKAPKGKSGKKFTGPKVPHITMPKMPGPDVKPLGREDLEQLRQEHEAAVETAKLSGRKGYIPPEQYKEQQQALRDSLDALVNGVLDAVRDPNEYLGYLTVAAKAPGLSPKNWAALYGQNKEGNVFKTKPEWWALGYGVQKEAEPSYLWYPKELTNPQTGEQYTVYNAVQYYDADQLFRSKPACQPLGGKPLPLEDLPTPIAPEDVVAIYETTTPDKDIHDAAIRCIASKVMESIGKNPQRMDPDMQLLAVRSATYVAAVNLGLNMDGPLGQRLTAAIRNDSADTLAGALSQPGINSQGKDVTMLEVVLEAANHTASSITHTVRSKVNNRERYMNRSAQQTKPQQKQQRKPARAGVSR